MGMAVRAYSVWIKMTETLPHCMRCSLDFRANLDCAEIPARCVKWDKRVILVDGEPIGAINRVPAKGKHDPTCMWAVVLKKWV